MINNKTKYKISLLAEVKNDDTEINKWFSSICGGVITATLESFSDGSRVVNVLGQKNTTNDNSEDDETLVLHTVIALFGTGNMNLCWLRKTSYFKSHFLIEKIV